MLAGFDVVAAGAAAAAVTAFHGERFVLIAGGSDKNLDYHSLAAALQKSPAQLIVLYGENKQKIAKTLSGIDHNTLIIKIVKGLAKKDI